MRAMIIGAVALAAVAFVACGGDDDEPLRNADEVRDEQRQQDRATAEQEAQPVGTAIELEYDVRVTVQGADRLTADEMGGRSPSAPDAEWLAVNVLVENRGDDEISAPDLNITCADGREGHWYMDEDPSALSTKPLPAKTQEEGRKLFGIPADCERPIVRAKTVGVVIVGEPKIARWQID